MERARHRKTKSASGIEGVRQIQKQKACPRLSSDSRSYIDGRYRDDMFILESGQDSLGGATGKPMGKLLAEEMSKDVEAKRRTPSIVAKLMGFEGLPSPRHVHRQQKFFGDSYQEKNVSINIPRNSQLYDARSNKRSSMDQQKFKDVHEDLEASHVANRRCSTRWSANSILTEQEMSLIQQKFIDAKRLSTDEKLQGSKELDDTLEMLDSNKDLLLKFLGQQDSLFVKHLHDLQVDPGSSRIAILKPSNSEKYESKAKEWRSERDTSNKTHVASHWKRKDGLLLEPHNHNRAHISRNSSRIQKEEEDEENMLPTRIVVLKPNLGKIQNAGTSCSSPDLPHGHLHNFKKPKEYPSVGGLETVSMRRTSSSHDAGLLKIMSKEARQIAREITMRMRNGYDETMDSKSAGYRGYVGDESSYDANESDSESESEVFKLSSRRRSFDDSNLCRYPSSRLRESSMNMEAKKRLSERWKMSHKYQDLEMGRSSTLGQMLALPDKETMPNLVHTKTSLSRTSKRHGSNKGTVVLDAPSGISSRDGWKDEICKYSSRSRSLPPSTGGKGRIHRRSSSHDKLAEEKNMMYNETVQCGKSKALKGNLSDKEDYSTKDLKSGSKKPHPCQQILTNEKGSSSEANFEIQMEPNTNDFSEQQFQMLEKVNSSKIPVVDVILISEPESTTMPSEAPVLLQKQSSSCLGSEKTSARDQENSYPQELHKGLPTKGSPPPERLGAELDSSECCKEADHPSPNSVLEVPFAEETSSSESFERVSAELQELRMQLQLLKMESSTYAEPSTLLTIDEEETQPSPTISEQNYAFGANSWMSSYALDILIHSGLEEPDFDMYTTKWHSQKCPVDPTLFDTLEKKYNNETSGLRPERRLLFDRINSTLLEILQEHVESCPWVLPKLAGLNSKWEKGGVLEKLIGKEFANGEMSGRELNMEARWDSRGEIEVLGNDIGNLLIDDMITEVICD